MVVLYSADDFRRRVSARLPDGDAQNYGDHRFNPGLEDFFKNIKRQPAAVLVPVIAHRHEVTVLLTERTHDLPSHPGQIAFPGGKVDAGDENVEAAALREAEEEIGLSRSHVEVLGRAPDYLTGSGFHIAPVLGLVSPGAALTLNPGEVADAFEVPLSFLMNPANHHRGSRIWQGVERTFFEMPYQDRYIWGVTAGILRVLYEQLYGDGQ
ncbi:MAG TPA: CoA pyrophosphatase [Afifellaceae bacterium]|nr:CoA pyrophosphatase [Afifellaceae bacterium]